MSSLCRGELVCGASSHPALHGIDRSFREVWSRSTRDYEWRVGIKKKKRWYFKHCEQAYCANLQWKHLFTFICPAIPLSEGGGSRGRDAGGLVVSANSSKAEFSILKFWIHRLSPPLFPAAPDYQGFVFPGCISTGKQIKFTGKLKKIH